MKMRKVLGCSVGVMIGIGFLVLTATGATLLAEQGIPERLLIRLGALLCIAGMALGYRVSKQIGAGPGTTQPAQPGTTQPANADR